MTTVAMGFDYPTLLRESLVGIVRGLIRHVADEGFPGDHHFLLTFDTNDPGVVMSARLRKQYPEEMTIVLQHQFWNLGADDAAFHVTLRFGGQPEPLTVPWSALRAFADPSVGFGLRLQPIVEPGSEPSISEDSDEQPDRPVEVADSNPSEAAPKAEGNVLDFSARRRKDSGQA